MTNTDTTLIPDQRDNMSRDEVLLAWQHAKDTLDAIKEEEMSWRKYVVKRAFPDAQEGMNKQELGQGYELKASVKFNYRLADNNTVEKTLDDIAKIGNRGVFIADRLVSWHPSFLLTEYRELQEQAKDSDEAQAILAKVGEMLVVTEAAPTLEIKAPKGKK